MRQLFIFAILGGLLLLIYRRPDDTQAVLTNASNGVSDTLHLKEALSVSRQAAAPGLQVARRGGTSAWKDIDKAFDVATKSNLLDTVQSGFLKAVAVASEWTTNALNYLSGDWGSPTSVVTRPS